MTEFDDAVVRLNQIGVGLKRRITPDAAARGEIARALDLAALDAFDADLEIRPVEGGWRLTGRIAADAVQTCGLTLEPLPVRIDETFSVGLVEASEPDSEDLLIDPEAEDAPDVVEDGRIDLLQYAVEQLALSLDPFPRKPGAVFTPPDQPAESSPFSVLNRLRGADDDGQG